MVYDDDDDSETHRERDVRIREKGGKNVRNHKALKMKTLRGGPELIDELEKDPKVRTIAIDREVGVAASGSQHLDPDEARTAMNLSGGSRGSYTGTGIGVAVIDSGVSPLDALRGGSKCTVSRIVYSENFASDAGTADLYGHGTHVASVLGADNVCDNTDYIGVAPGVNIINLRVLNAQGLGTDSGVIAAIDRAIQLKSTYKIRVINLSLGRSVFSSFTADPISLAVERAWKAGIVVVVAAGNLGRNGETQGYGTIASPGNSPYVITVGAVRNPAGGSDSRTDDTLTSYSSKGPTAIDQVAKPDLVAPGNLMVARTVFPSTLTTVYPANAMLMMSKQYLKLSGTSMAAPAVAGTAAMMIQKDSTLTPDQVKARLMKTAWKGYLPTASIYDSVTNTSYWVQHDLFAVGAGYLDASAALASTRKIGSTQSALSPRVVRQNGQVVMTTSYPNVTGVGVVWGTDVLWGTGVVWGTQVLQANGVVWGSGVVWGTDVASGYGVIWGTQGVTGTSNPFPMALAGNGDN